MDKVDCKDCLSFDVCQYKDLLLENDFDLQINHPFLKIICTKFIPKKSKLSKDRQEIIRQWRVSNPNGKKIDCEKETGISRPTILKYWDGDEKGEE